MKKLMAVAVAMLIAGVASAATPKEPVQVVLTFDDGIRDHLTLVAPLLEARGWRGVFSIVTDLVGKDQACLTWDEVKELARRGHIVANHSRSHQSMTTLLNAGKVAVVREEILGAQRIFKEKAGLEPRYFCPPFTDLDERTARICREAGLTQMSRHRHQFGAGTEGTERKFIEECRRKGEFRTDVMSHGVSVADAGGWKAYAKEDFVRHLDALAELEREGEIKVVSYDEAFGPEPELRWDGSEWLSVRDAPTVDQEIVDCARAAPGTSWFVTELTNAATVVRARWMTTALGVYELYVNGRRPGSEVLKPGYTHPAKTKYAFTYDITELLKFRPGEVNVLAAEVSAGWWRDMVVTEPGHKGFAGRKSAFRGVLELEYADGTRQLVGTEPRRWRAGIAGPVKAAAIFDGERYDAREPFGYEARGKFAAPEVNSEFKGEILPTDGGEVVWREDLTLKPVRAYVWRGVDGAADAAYGTVRIVREFAPSAAMTLNPGETLVIDFGQNAAAVPGFMFSASRGTELTALPAEMLNEAGGVKSRGNDGPGGSVYRANLRALAALGSCKLEYVFAGRELEGYRPRFTYFGYRYLSVTATAPVRIEAVVSVPLSSVRREDESATLEVGDPALNRLVQNSLWSMRSNYLSIPQDCPQRDERQGWLGDAQVYCETGCYFADVRKFFGKFLRDIRDSVGADGGFTSVAPAGQYGGETFNFGFADGGVIIPWTVWRQFGELEPVKAHFETMANYVRQLEATRYDFEGMGRFIYADWLSSEKFGTFLNWERMEGDPDARNYRRFLAACYWLYDAELVADLAAALGKTAEARHFAASAQRARAYIRGRFLEADGMLLKPMREQQTGCVFALKFGIVEGAARAQTKALLVKAIRDSGGRRQTGFLGTSLLLETLAAEGEFELAYELLLRHGEASWLYSVDQGATTIWEHWNGYSKEKGFGPVNMNSFNHYAQGSAVAWLFRQVAGIATDSSAPGFRRLRLSPHPDRRLGHLKAAYRTPFGTVTSEWRYEGQQWHWQWTVPDGATATVQAPGSDKAVEYAPGSYQLSVRLP